MSKPSFGEKVEGIDYQARYAAYIIVSRNNGQEMVLVQAPNGAYFLPGGEIENNETKEEAINREMIEELGVEVEIGWYIGEAQEYFYSRHRDTYFFNPGYFYSAKSWKKIGDPTETTNQLVWLTPQEAIVQLKRGSHQWAVTEWLKKGK
ncbi:NUDIX family hydrolase [Enterococcus phoeniculicola]|jgi:8-oxo-dGTP diphosphatase|uniref:NUDIX family hydrolase n=1 Tax=Enterococcus phoeniculicola ATCC BAA-412 TaxID=1158610 RepID=R3W3G0_9ENTE|nr:NUDIX hydrolase [Enterococcus phoeniculicola]EOL42212.1 NUDIX family hydrolase [Enterococcus phoeniculicola ATCC BAA-412]EOT79509.1 NUDIX family hydrolase [Enterococcus phoeniculicola ATCC BAA-412]OJG70373.1 NUDIX family hydrolase [Enterococcus phoeniculicola]